MKFLKDISISLEKFNKAKGRYNKIEDWVKGRTEMWKILHGTS